MLALLYLVTPLPHLQSTKEEDTSDSNLLRPRYLNLGHFENWQRNNHGIHYDVRDRVSDEEAIFVETFSTLHKGLPCLVDWRALENGGEDYAYPPSECEATENVPSEFHRSRGEYAVVHEQYAGFDGAKYRSVNEFCQEKAL
jgi:hypothetical protein